MERPGTTDWNERFSTEGYVFGRAPAQFLTRQAALMPEGAEVLCVADGEGRNAVFLAGEGHRVTAFDVAPAALEKARALAEESGVEADFHQAGIEDWDWGRGFDVVAGIFVQFVGPPEKRGFLQNMGRAVRPGGLLMLHGYVPR